MQIPIDFPVSVFGTSNEKISETITKKRVRIFYCGENRNGSYISKEFAEKLLSTLPYTPIKGIYDINDFGDHGEKRTEGRIYGVVPENPNISWEKHLDEDNVEREYACADVYLFTALYEEANEISGKGQSMELYRPSIRGEWIKIGDKNLYRYTDACFLGLQVLGDNAIPCFEGSAFFSLDAQKFYTLFTTLLEKIEKINQGGENYMENILQFSLSNNQKQNAIFKALNNEIVRYLVVDNYDTYAIVYDMETDNFMKVEFTVSEDNTIMLSDATQFKELLSEYVTSEEKKALDILRSKTEEGTYESVVNSYEEQNGKISELETDLANKNDELATLAKDNETLNLQNQDLNSTIEKYELELNDLRNFKMITEKQAKETLISKYSKKLPEEILNDFKKQLDNFTITDLDKELAYKLVHTDASILTEENNNAHCVPTLNTELSGLEALLTKHKNS